MKINIFSENIYSEDKLSPSLEKKALAVAKKILRYYLKDEGIICQSCLRGLEYSSISFDIVYCNDEKTHQINAEYRKKDYAADIITFAIFADTEEKFIFDGEINLGEIIISLDKIEKNAQEKNCSNKEELFFLVSHGIMHLLGFDHQSQEEYDFIVKTQNEALINLKNTTKE